MLTGKITDGNISLPEEVYQHYQYCPAECEINHSSRKALVKKGFWEYQSTFGYQKKSDAGETPRDG
jgi:hypothetical protein